MKTTTLFLMTFGIFISMNAQNLTFNNLTNPASGDGSITFYNGLTKGYKLTEQSTQGYLGQVLSFQYFSPGIGTNLLNFIENSVVIGNPVLSSHNLYVNGSSGFEGNIHFYDQYFQNTLTVDPKSFFNNVAVFNSNVGIGVQNPLEKLHINGSIRGSESGGTLKLKSNSGYLTLGAQNSFYLHFITDRPQFYFNKPIYVESGVIASYNTSDLKLQTNSTTRITITNSNGNVGIGTSIPDEKLTVKGKIHAEEVKIDLSVPGPDFVFEKYYTGVSTLKKDYTMPTLEELESFTKKYNRLPQMPSAKEMKEKGLQIGEMTTLLLQKIEELTLYTIEQEKRIKNLELKLESKN